MGAQRTAGRGHRKDIGANEQLQGIVTGWGA